MKKEYSQTKRKSSLEEHFNVYKNNKNNKTKPPMKKQTPIKTHTNTKKKISTSKIKKVKIKKTFIKSKKENKWMLPVSYLLAFLFFIPFGALIGIIFGIISFKNSEKKIGAIIAITLNVLLGFFNYLWTSIVIDVFIFGNG
ncbi:hypothetical protein HOD20_09505 [archaeon]|jgi:hypothetical protein|nr:hypothetical protein [archaeon]MBT4352745.1 hypothetical protein [archaeon]MBT4648148.1 hypothetical protein [archaeon]MBT6822434.1 hypothetical protein [archaeon]MBT7391903.1 hypothetical protein [archaeon]